MKCYECDSAFSEKKTTDFRLAADLDLEISPYKLQQPKTFKQTGFCMGSIILFRRYTNLPLVTALNAMRSPFSGQESI